jgi:major membrane immunogen (membrane-anchored lipoprotein)
MKVLTFVLCVIATSLLLTACTTESDPAPKCTTKAISYQDFKADYKPSDGS